MGEAFITRRGGSGGKPFAVIGVTYPAGSTVTCTNGTKTLTAKDTTGGAMFIIPTAGTWTVTAVDGDKTKSATVEITTEGQVETVELTYELVLYDNGDECSAVTGGWTGHGHSWGSGNNGMNVAAKYNGRTCLYVYGTFGNANTKTWEANTKNAIDITKYTALKARVLKSYARSGVAIFDSDNAYSNQLAIQTCGESEITTSTVISCDISSLTGANYPGIGTFKYANGLIYADKVWLE